MSFDRPPISDFKSEAARGVRGYVEDIDSRLSSGRGLWLVGNVGTGKTAMAMLVSKAVVESGHSVAIYSLPKLLARIRSTYEAETGEQSYLEFFDRLTSVDLLHLDDLGAERRTDWVIEQLYAVVNERYESERAILVTMNIDDPKGTEALPAAIERLQDGIGRRTVSRLLEICGDPLPHFGPDLRWEP